MDSGESLAADPDDRAGHGVTDAAAFADAGRADDQQEVQMSLGKSTDIVLELRVGRHADGVLR